MCNQSEIQKFPNASDWPVKGQILGIDEISLDIVTFKETTYQFLTLCLCALLTVFAFFHIVFETSQLVEKYHETIHQAPLKYRSLVPHCPYPFPHLNTKLFPN